MNWWKKIIVVSLILMVVCVCVVVMDCSAVSDTGRHINADKVYEKIGFWMLILSWAIYGSVVLIRKMKTKKTFLVVGIVIASFILAPVAIGFVKGFTEASRALNYYKQGVADYNKKEYGRAISGFSKAIELNSRSAKAYNARGLTYAKNGDIDRAVFDFDKAIELSPGNPNIYFNKGQSYVEAGKYGEAIVDYDEAIKYSPNDSDIYNARALAYAKNGKIDKAVIDLNKAIELNPRNYVFYYGRGIVYLTKGDYNKAISDYNKAIEINPKLSDAYFHRGLAYSSSGNYDRALDDMHKAESLGLKVDPDIMDKIKKASEHINTSSTPSIHYGIQEPKGNTMDLVPYIYKSFNFQFDIKYPAKWYASEEIGGAPSLYFTPQPIASTSDQYTVGVGFIYGLNYFLKQESPDSPFGKMAKDVFVVQDWSKAKQRIVESLKTQKAVSDLTQKDTTIAGQPALEVNFTKATTRAKGLFIKAGVHLLNITFEAPKDEYSNYEKIFDNMLVSFSFSKDFAFESEDAILDRKTQELMVEDRQ